MGHAYDKAKWHFGGSFPEDVPLENGGTHIGFFLAWAINNDMAGESLRSDAGEQLLAVAERRMTGRTLLFDQLDGVLADEDLNEQGNGFARHYYQNYMAAYDRLFRSGHDTAYHVDDSWENFDLIASVLDDEYESWTVTLEKASRAMKPTFWGRIVGLLNRRHRKSMSGR